MGEPRAELLRWLNDLLQLNYTKVEQCGNGAAYCQIMDSIYGDVQMSKVKMDAKVEYESLSNYKILKRVFIVNNIDKVIPVEELVKGKLQDNLAFLQWIRRFWDANTSGAPYDAVARRNGGGASGAQPARDGETPEPKRDFYLNKLRDIEIIVQERLAALDAEGQTDATLERIQEILHRTEDDI